MSQPDTGREPVDDHRFDSDLDEADLQSAFGFARLDLTRLLHRHVLSAVTGVAVALLVALWPERTDRVLARLIAIAIVLLFSSAAVGAWSARPRQWPRIGLAAVCIGLGGGLFVWPDQSIVLIARVGAAVLAFEACRDVVGRLRRPTHARSWAWPLAKAFAGLATAALIAVYPNELLALATVLIALGWAVVGIVALAHSLSADTPTYVRYQDSRDIIVVWLDSRPKTADDRRTLYGKVLYEGPDLRKRIVRFVALMSLAGVISAMGVITDSTAVVIGAMLVAPLMTPLMGTAISVVMGWPNRLTRSASIVLLGLAIAIAIGVVLGVVAPTTIDVGANSQIVSRSTPTILDLITAVAAGGAGAYGLSRPDVSDALPGVAIAIALVPPLSVVGIAYSQGAWSEGNGALLLFVTNALAIVIIGGLTFIFTGVTPIRQLAGNQRRVRTASASIVALGAIVVGALALNGGEITANAFRIETVERTVDEWAEEAPGFSAVEARLDGNRVTAVILGPASDPPTAESLHARLQEELGRTDLVVDVRLLIEELDAFPADAIDDISE